MKTHSLQFRPEFTRREAIKGLTLGTSATLLSPFLSQLAVHAAALIAGLTNVITLTSGSGGQRFGKYPERGAQDLHGLANHRIIGSLYNTLLHAAGRPRAKFGLDDTALKDAKQGGPLAELLA